MNIDVQSFLLPPWLFPSYIACYSTLTRNERVSAESSLKPLKYPR